MIYEKILKKIAEWENRDSSFNPWLLLFLLIAICVVLGGIIK